MSWQRTSSKNVSDAHGYSAVVDLHARCINIIVRLWSARNGVTVIRSVTTGSSESINLGGLARERRWQEKRMTEVIDAAKPNVFMAANTQVALEMFAR